MTTTMQYFDLIEALPNEGCAICRLLQRSAERYLDAILYEYINKLPTHQAIRAGRGLCNQHQWHLQERRGNSLHIAIMCRAALDEVLTVEQKASSNGVGGFKRLLGRFTGVADSLEPTGPCMVCHYMDDIEGVLIGMVADNIADTRLLDAYRGSGGFCLPHIRHVLRNIKQSDKAEAFLKIQREIWQTLHDELDLFVRKNDIEYVDQHIGAEGDSWRRAIRYLSGEKGIFGLRR